jgi:hypothetical protein
VPSNVLVEPTLEKNKFPIEVEKIPLLLVVGFATGLQLNFIRIGYPHRVLADQKVSVLFRQIERGILELVMAPPRAALKTRFAASRR